MQRIYVAEDEENIRELIAYSLEAFGYEVKTYEDGQELLNACEVELPNLVILDWMMPKLDGLETLERLRSEKKTAHLPVIMLTAKTAETDKVRGLDFGADDYVTKPFGVLELKSRVSALLRRINRVEEKETDLLTFDDIQMFIKKHEVFVKGQKINLSNKEYELLKLLLLAQGDVVEREHILHSVWGYDFIGETRTLDMHMKTLRGKIDIDQEDSQIETIRGVGYKLRKHEEKHIL